MWEMLAGGGLGAILGGLNADNKNQQKQIANQAGSVQTRWSPWTGMGQAQMDYSYEDPAMAAIKGGISGAMAANKMMGGMGGGGIGDLFASSAPQAQTTAQYDPSRLAMMGSMA